MAEQRAVLVGARVASGAALQEAPSPLVALIGPPNSGKTTLFNQLTGLRQKVANYPGVTVEKKVGTVALPDGGELDLVDLPGVHGFSARTLDERVTRDVLEGRVEGIRAPDALVLIVDSTRLESQLMLVEPVLELDLPTLLVLAVVGYYAYRQWGSLGHGALDPERRKFALKKEEQVIVVCPNCAADISVPRLGKMQLIVCDTCGNRGEMEA